MKQLYMVNSGESHVKQHSISYNGLDPNSFLLVWGGKRGREERSSAITRNAMPEIIGSAYTKTMSG